MAMSCGRQRNRGGAILPGWANGILVGLEKGGSSLPEEGCGKGAEWILVEDVKK